VRFFDQAGKASGGESASLLHACVLAALEQDTEKVEQLLSRLVRSNSDDIDAYLALARLYQRRGEVGRAISLHQTLVLRRDLEPARRIFALAELGADFQSGGFTRRAIASFEEALAHDAHHQEALAALVELLADEGEHARALAMQRRLERVKGQRDPEREAALWLGVARASLEEGRSDRARKAVKKAIRRDPACSAAQLMLGDLEAARGKHERALSAWSKVLEPGGPLAAEVFSRLAAAFASVDRSADYEALLRKRSSGAPEDCETRLALARHLAGQGEADAAIAELRGALDHEPSHLGVHVALGELLVSLDREVDALKEYAALMALLMQSGLASRPLKALLESGLASGPLKEISR